VPRRASVETRYLPCACAPNATRIPVGWLVQKKRESRHAGHLHRLVRSPPDVRCCDCHRHDHRSADPSRSAARRCAAALEPSAALRCLPTCQSPLVAFASAYPAPPVRSSLSIPSPSLMYAPVPVLCPSSYVRPYRALLRFCARSPYFSDDYVRTSGRRRRTSPSLAVSASGAEHSGPSIRASSACDHESPQPLVPIPVDRMQRLRRRIAALPMPRACASPRLARLRVDSGAHSVRRSNCAMFPRRRHALIVAQSSSSGPPAPGRREEVLTHSPPSAGPRGHMWFAELRDGRDGVHTDGRCVA